MQHVHMQHHTYNLSTVYVLVYCTARVHNNISFSCYINKARLNKNLDGRCVLVYV